MKGERERRDLLGHSRLDAVLGPVVEEAGRIPVFITVIVGSVSPAVNNGLLQQTRALTQ